MFDFFYVQDSTELAASSEVYCHKNRADFQVYMEARPIKANIPKNPVK